MNVLYPKIETHIINRGNAMGGAGEPGIAPALANAIYDASGFRVRRVPLNPIALQHQSAETDTRV